MASPEVDIHELGTDWSPSAMFPPISTPHNDLFNKEKIPEISFFLVNCEHFPIFDGGGSSHQLQNLPYWRSRRGESCQFLWLFVKNWFTTHSQWESNERAPYL